MPIDEGVNVDLQFLILEVTKQARASLSCLEKPTPGKINKIKEREEYIDNLKNTLENKSYYNIHHLDNSERQMYYFKALINIGANLERISDYFEKIASQLQELKNTAHLQSFEFRKYFQLFYRSLDSIYPALMHHDIGLAQKICDSEESIDVLYDESYGKIREYLSSRSNINDTLIALFISRYLALVGDSLLNIGESILNIHLGEKIGIRQFRNLSKALVEQDIDLGSEHVEFKSIMNTRSGCKVAKIIDHEPDSPDKIIFYKEGLKKKIDEEVTGLKRWKKIQAFKVPGVLWHDSRKKHSTILLEYIEGSDLLDILINDRRRIDDSLNLLSDSLYRLWEETHRSKPVKSNHISQLMHRQDDILSVHTKLFKYESDMEELLKDAKKLESNLKSPFSVLIHGDFNVDNIIFKKDEDQIYFVDVHRSAYGDYVQDISVFMVSCFRIPLFSVNIRNRLNETNLRIFESANNYAATMKDDTFQARLALGLFRSLITSTRFLFDEGFTLDLFLRGTRILKDLLEYKDKPQDFILSHEHFLYQ